MVFYTVLYFSYENISSVNEKTEKRMSTVAIFITCIVHNNPLNCNTKAKPKSPTLRTKKKIYLKKHQEKTES